VVFVWEQGREARQELADLLAREGLGQDSVTVRAYWSTSRYSASYSAFFDRCVINLPKRMVDRLENELDAWVVAHEFGHHLQYVAGDIKHDGRFPIWRGRLMEEWYDLLKSTWAPGTAECELAYAMLPWERGADDYAFSVVGDVRRDLARLESNENFVLAHYVAWLHAERVPPDSDESPENWITHVHAEMSDLVVKFKDIRESFVVLA
jgi:hypothetical protein